MKKIVFVLVLIMSVSLWAKGVQKKGAKIGKWTMDYSSALAKAEAEDVPVFLQFTGSDWCPWCKLMAKNVFSKKSWKNYVAKRLYLVYLDYPRYDKSLVPKKYRERNQLLASQYAVRGFPTYIILDSDGKTELGRLGAGKEKTGESFVKEVNAILRKRPAKLKKFMESLPDTVSITLKKRMSDLKKTKTALNQWIATRPEKNEKNIKKYNQFLTTIDKLNKEIDNIFNQYSK